MDEGIAVIIAAVLAIAGIFYNSRQQRKLLRKQHTYQVLDKLNDWDEFERKLDFARSLSRTGRLLRLCEDDKDDCDKIDSLLNYYEFLSSAIICGDIDEGLVRHVEYDRLCRTYLKFIYYVEAVRDADGSNTIWIDLEFMCYRWRVEQRDIFDNLIDEVRLRPNRTRFEARRDEVKLALTAYAQKLK